MTDGRPQNDFEVSNHLKDYDRDCSIEGATCGNYDRKSGREYESSGSDYADDVTRATA